MTPPHGPSAPCETGSPRKRRGCDENRPKPLKGSPRPSFASFCRFPSGASAKYRGTAAHAREQPALRPVRFLRNGVTTKKERRDENRPKPLKGSPRPSFAHARANSPRCGLSASCETGSPRKRRGCDENRPKPLKGSPRPSFASFCRFPSGASAKYRGTAAHAREQPALRPVRFLRNGVTTKKERRDENRPKPLKGSPRPSFAHARANSPRCGLSASCETGSPRKRRGCDENRPKSLKRSPRPSFAHARANSPRCGPFASCETGSPRKRRGATRIGRNP